MDEVLELVRIGAGSFATVKVLRPVEKQALKIVADPSRCADLKKEYADLQRLFECLVDCHIRVPRPFAYYDSYGLWKSTIYHSAPIEAEDPACLYEMERVHPLPNLMAETIRRRFFPETAREDKGLFIARVYLGRKPADAAFRRTTSKFFNRNNFPLCEDDIDQLREEFPALESPEAMAAHMGKLLARIHFCASRDGRDIEIVLGGHADAPLSRHGLFCIDFNQMRPHDGSVGMLVDSLISNDPYFPRPGMRCWAAFERAYLSEAQTVSPSAHQTAARVTAELESMHPE